MNHFLQLLHGKMSTNTAASAGRKWNVLVRVKFLRTVVKKSSRVKLVWIFSPGTFLILKINHKFK